MTTFTVFCPACGKSNEIDYEYFYLGIVIICNKCKSKFEYEYNYILDKTEDSE